MNAPLTIQFLGGAQTVTGSKHLVSYEDKKILIDCGMFQGLKELRLKNWEPIGVDPAEIDIVLLTHGHLDHSSYLPKLVQDGFKGLILATAPTIALAEIITADSARIMEEEAERANKEGYSKHDPAKPLYSEQDVVNTKNLFRTIQEGEWIDLFEDIKCRFNYNGHIIGSCYIDLQIAEKRLVFSGDIGRKSDVLLKTYKKPLKADYLFVETTYGDRLHDDFDPKETLRDLIKAHFLNYGEVMLIPSFAVERTQLMMYLLWQLKVEGELDGIDLIMDSPMASKVLELFQMYRSWHELKEEDLNKIIASFKIVSDYKETWEVIDKKSKKIVVAGSGMLTGGRMLTYLQNYLEKQSTLVMLTGYQAPGTRGYDLLDGVKSIKIRGKYYPVYARIENFDLVSAHGDQSELLDWMSDLEHKPQKVFLIHGELEASSAFKEKLLSLNFQNSYIPAIGDRFEL